jgi:hypothetical protein
MAPGWLAPPLSQARASWFFLSRHVQLTGAVYWLAALFLLGVVLI